MSKAGLWIVLLLILHAQDVRANEHVSVPGQLAQTSAQTADKRANTKLTGSWRLVSWISRQPDGTLKHVMGENPTGLLIYDSSGNMSVQIMDSFRPDFEMGYSATNLEELKKIFDGYLAYFGTYTIDETQHAVVHHVKAITNPSFYGADLIRYFDLSGDQLVLSLDKDKNNSLTWVRIKD